MPAASSTPEKVSPPPVKMTHSVQAGAFRTRGQAEKLVGTLKKIGYPAGILPVTDSRGKSWFTVRVGDYPSRGAAIEHANEFTAREKIASAVRPFGKL